MFHMGLTQAHRCLPISPLERPSLVAAIATTLSHPSGGYSVRPKSDFTYMAALSRPMAWNASSTRTAAFLLRLPMNHLTAVTASEASFASATPAASEAASTNLFTSSLISVWTMNSLCIGSMYIAS
jgi:hypothetical protein